jgi:hypothetical protein
LRNFSAVSRAFGALSMIMRRVFPNFIAVRGGRRSKKLCEKTPARMGMTAFSNKYRIFRFDRH